MRIPRFFQTPVLLVFLLASCGGNAAEGGSSAASVSSVPPTIESSPSPTRGITWTPASPAAAAPTETEPAPETLPGGLNAAGPYAVFEGDNGIWIANPDGSSPTRIAERGAGPGGQDLHSALSPSGDRMALVTETQTGLDLVLIEIPGGETETLARLLDITRVERMLNSFTPKAFAHDAIADYPNLAWQPGEGNILAYIGAEKAATADVYTYDRTWEKFRHLETDPSQAVHPVWSPDGEYVLYFGVDWLPPFGSTYVTFEPMAGFWAVRVSDNQLIPQPAPKGTDQNLLGWRDAAHYLVYDSDKECPARNLRMVDVATGDAVPIAEFCLHSRPAWSPANGAILLSVDAGCDCPLGEGVFLILPGLPDPVRLLEQAAFELFWLPESGTFYAYPYALFSADGGTRYDPPAVGSSYQPAVSPSGRQAWEVSLNKKSVLTIREPGGEWQTVFEGKIGALVWDPLSGDILLIALENGELYAASAPDFVPRMTGNLVGPIIQAAWIPAPE
jgi:hypothetical protein